MRMLAATAGIVSSAMLVSGCDRVQAPRRAEASDPIRRAVYASLAAQARVSACGAPAPRDDGRFAELKSLARIKHADHAIWLGENEWNAVRARSVPQPCGAGGAEAARRDYAAALDGFANAIIAFQE